MGGSGHKRPLGLSHEERGNKCLGTGETKAGFRSREPEYRALGVEYRENENTDRRRDQDSENNEFKVG